MTVVIDEDLLRAVLEETGLATKREAIEESLKTLLQLKRQERIRRFRGALEWEGDLDAMRGDR